MAGAMGIRLSKLPTKLKLKLVMNSLMIYIMSMYEKWICFAFNFFLWGFQGDWVIFFSNIFRLSSNLRFTGAFQKCMTCLCMKQ